MGVIRIAAPPKSLYFFGRIIVVDMETERETVRALPGEQMEIQSEISMDLGIAWGRLGAPAVRLRFTAHPGRTYCLHWQTQHFGASLTLTEADK